MKKLSLFIFALALVNGAYAQNCLKIKQGQHIKISGYRWNNDEVFMPAYAKMSESKREKKALEFNAKVLAGEIKTTGGVYDYDVKSVALTPGTERALVTTEIGGKKYESIIACVNDTMYFTRIVGMSYSADSKGDTIGFGILGVQVIPNKLKVGDKLQPYEDISMVIPEATSYTAKHSILKGYETSVRSYRDIGYDPATGWGPGTTTKTETKAIYETVDVNVRQTTRFASTAVNYAVAVVTGEEEVSIDGVKYKAYRIDSETWIKPNVTKSYEATNAEWKQNQEGWDEKVKKLMDARGIKKGYLNAQGFTVSYRTEWFVPGIGMAKMVIYDNFGNMMAGGATESIK